MIEDGPARQVRASLDHSTAHVPDSGPLHGRGAFVRLVRAHGWEQTAFGPIHGWSGTLISMVNLALNSALPTCIHWGPELRMIYNESYSRILQERHPQALGQPVAEVWSSLWSQLGQQFEAVLTLGEPGMEERLSIAAGPGSQERDEYWSYSLSPILEPGGRVAGVFSIGQNVSSSVRLVDALVESEERLRVALSASDCVGTWDWHLASDLVYTEEHFATVYGTDPRAAAQGMPISEFLKKIHAEDQERVQLAIAQAVETGQEYSCEYRLLQADGFERWVSAKGRCLFNAEGNPVRFPGITVDITQQRLAEAVMLQPMAVPDSVNPLLDPELIGPQLQRELERTMETIYRAEQRGLLGQRALDMMEELAAPLERVRSLVGESLEEGASPEAARAHLLEAQEEISQIAQALAPAQGLETSFSLHKPVDVVSVAAAAFSLKEWMAQKRTLHLVQSEPIDAQAELQMTQMLRVLWSLIGEVLNRHGEQEPESRTESRIKERAEDRAI